MTNREDVETLFQKGFFGKGTLSRSDPTWRARRIDMVKGGSSQFFLRLYFIDGVRKCSIILMTSCKGRADPRQTPRRAKTV